MGMCGPIAIALPGREGAVTNFIHKSLYNLGRVVTYSFLGLITGFIGQGFSMAGWQQGISIALGVLMIALMLISGFQNLNIPLVGPISSITSGIKRTFSHFLKKRGFLSIFFIGMVNGLLPCGLVYIALAASIAGGSVESGVLYMFVFGLGTFPIMLLASLAGNIIGPTIRRKIYRLVPVFIVTLGLLFILRGMNLGIPYISPQLEGDRMGDPIENCDP